jgi:carbamoyltransferase
MPVNTNIYVAGISAFYHDAACCILKNDKLVAAAEEERFTRKKHDPSLPVNAFRYCLREAGITIDQLDAIAFYEDPYKKFSRQLWSNVFQNSWETAMEYGPHRIEHEIREKLAYEKDIRYYDHHLSHAASSFFYSGFDKAAIMTVDGVGEWATTTYGTGRDGKIELFEEVRFPDSLGLLYSTLTSYLGFKVNGGEYKLMGLAPYGKPLYTDLLWKLVSMKPNGQYELNLQYFDFINGDRMYSDALPALLGQAPRKPADEFTDFHKDIARSIQLVLETILLQKAAYLYEQTKMENLCLAGGVALNCVANGRILREGPFKKIFVQPAANDAGGALGAAALAMKELQPSRELFHEPMKHAYLGPSYSNQSIRRMLAATGLEFTEHEDNTGALLHEVATRLSEGKIIGWFQGRMEFGPRALGNRSILADPRGEHMRDRINSLVKKREAFRPFAPVVLEEKASAYFDTDHPLPFMLETCPVIHQTPLPAITHVDGSARVQTVNAQTNARSHPAQHLVQCEQRAYCMLARRCAQMFFGCPAGLPGAGRFHH